METRLRFIKPEYKEMSPASAGVYLLGRAWGSLRPMRAKRKAIQLRPRLGQKAAEPRTKVSIGRRRRPKAATEETNVCSTVGRGESGKRDLNVRRLDGTILTSRQELFDTLSCRRVLGRMTCPARYCRFPGLDVGAPGDNGFARPIAPDRVAPG